MMGRALDMKYRFVSCVTCLPASIVIGARGKRGGRHCDIELGAPDYTTGVKKGGWMGGYEKMCVS